MALTKRAQSWLATLKREEPLPTAEVERLIRAAGWPPPQAWLDFHDKYAGYVEEVGPGDLAIWGLARPMNPGTPLRWRDLGNVIIVPPHYRFPEAILCADASPHHGYELGSDGAFRGIGGPALTFEMK